MSKTANRAFTIVELMVVVAIIAIVVAMAVPAQIRSSQVRHARTCQENLATIAGAIDTLAIDNQLPDDAPITLQQLQSTTGTTYLRQIPLCPAGGTYAVSTAAAKPTCTISHNPNAPYAPHILSTRLPHTDRAENNT